MSGSIEHIRARPKFGPVIRSQAIGALLALTFLVAGGHSAGWGKNLAIDFHLLYQAALLANQTYTGKSELFGKAAENPSWATTTGKTSVHYILLHNHKRKVQVIAVRGTVGRPNWDLNMDTRGTQGTKSGILMHHGFRVGAAEIYREIKARLMRNYSTYLTGHSLGGAVAAILGTYLLDDKFKVEGIYTFGQPKFTNPAGARAYRDLPLLRVIYQNDVAALWPTKTKRGNAVFAHVGAAINLLSGPYYVYGTADQTLNFSQGSMGKLFGQVSVPDHKLKYYLKNLRGKLEGATEVRLQDRNKYIVRHNRGIQGTTGEFERKFNFN